MNRLVEKRKYQRCSNLICKVLVSKDEKKWNNVELLDISAGGMKIKSPEILHANSSLYFQVYVYNMLAEFNLRFEAEVVRFEKDKFGVTYAVKFVSMSKYHQIQLDELVKSKISVAENKKVVHDFGEDSVFKKKKSRKNIKIYF